jgi:signal peptidase I
MNTEPLRIDQPFFIELMKAVLEQGAPVRFVASGFSMSPFIKSGDCLTVAPPGARIAVGTVIAFLRPESNTLVVHRVIARNGDTYLLKGDNILGPDGWIGRADVLGEVVKIERRTKAVLFGLGSEKRLFAFLSRCRVFPYVFWPLRVVRGGLRKAVAMILSPGRGLEQKAQQQPPDVANLGKEKGEVHEIVDQKDADRACDA